MINLFGLLSIQFFFISLIQEDFFTEKRLNMVETQIISRGITDQRVIDVFRRVQRHLFVPDELSERAYQDRPLPIGYGQTISQPYMVAFMTEVINPKPEYRVLEIGSGSGYQAAILTELVSEVYTIEIIPELANTVSDRFKKLGYSKIKALNADGYFGWPSEAPFDAIVVTAAAEHIPPPLIKQLKNGGKMIIPVGSPFLVQSLLLITKIDNKITTENLMPVRFVPFKRSGK